MGVEIKKDILSIDLLNELHDYVSSRSGTYCWRPNTINWGKELTEGSSPVMTMDLSEFRDKLHHSIAKHFPEVTDTQLSIPYPMFFSMPPMSQIGWHQDYTPFNVSIYLNEFWDKRWGGLFIHEDADNTYSAIVPEFNKAVIVRQNTQHHVSMVHPFCPVNRFSVQLFFVEPEHIVQS